MSILATRVRQTYTFDVDRLPYRAITTPEALHDLSEVYHFARSVVEQGVDASPLVQLFDGRFTVRQEPVEIARLAIEPTRISFDAATVTDKASEYATSFAQDFWCWIRRVGQLGVAPGPDPVLVEEETLVPLA